jgi:hypothetical protein
LAHGKKEEEEEEKKKKTTNAGENRGGEWTTLIH